jgi:hypothetical protein
MSLYRMLQRRGTAAQWATANTILGVGEMGFAYDTNVVKIGNGSTPWNSLPSIDGKSAYEIAVSNGFVGTESAWLLSLVGDPGDISSKLNLSGGTMTGPLTLSGPPTSNLHAATKIYVDEVAVGIVTRPQVLGATTANIDATYQNGTAGVGATLTHNTNGVFPSEAGGATGWALNSGILVKNQTNKAHNGRYRISDMGSASTPYVLTRCGFCDTADEIPGSYVFVQSGTNTGTGWIQVVDDPATFVVGTDNIEVFQFSGAGTITAGTNISVSGNEVSVIGSPTFSGTIIGAPAEPDANANTAKNLGYIGLPQVTLNTGNLTLSKSHAGKHIYVTGASQTITIPANSSVPFEIGTTIAIINANLTSSIAITTDTLRLAGTATTGTRTLAAYGMATLIKVEATTWIASGNGLT